MSIILLVEKLKQNSLSPLRVLSHFRFPTAARQWQRVAGGVVVFLLIVATITLSFLGEPTSAASFVLDGRKLLEGESSFSTINQSKDGAISLQAGDLGKWSGHDGMQNLPSRNNYYDTDMVYGPNNSLYLMGYSAECHFNHYDINRGKWRDLPVPPVSCAAGTGIAYNGTNTIYYLPGGGSAAFFAFDVSTETWRRLADAPSTINDRADMTYIPSGQGKLYAFRGGTSAVLLSYDVAAQTWDQHAPFPANSSVQYGLSLAWDGLGSLYAITGNWGEFGRYSILNDEWEKYSNLPDTGTRFNTLVRAGDEIFNIQHRWCCSSSNGEQIYLRKYVPATQSWEDIASPVSGYNADNPSAAAYDGNDTLYILSGENPRIIYKYSISSSSWGNDNFLAGTGNSTNYHGQPIFDNNQYVYYSGGSSQNTFDGLYRLDLITHETVQLGTYPAFAEHRVGFQGAYFNNALYLTSYSNTYSFARFNLDTNSWTQLPNLPVRAYYGMDLVDGGDGYLYVTFGGGSRQFWRYNDANGWQQLTDSPLTVQYTGNAMTKIGSYLYLLASNSDARIMRYDLTTSQWITLDAYLPSGSTNYGSFLISDKNRHLYVVASDRLEAPSKAFYRYDTQTSEWRRMADLPGPVNVMAGGFYDQITNRVYVTPGIGLPYLWHWSPTSDDYVAEGTWYSKPIDLTQVSGWQALTVQSSGSGDVEVYTRTSTHGKIWNDWVLASGGTITSSPQRYLQIRIVLRGNKTSTPTVTGLDVQYDQESVAPSLPSQFEARGEKDGPALSSGQTYEYQHPYFTWQGSSDGANGSGVKGYHVYFGTDSGADPLIAGSFQESNEYIVTTAMSSGSVNYLRLRVEDNLGNISDAATYFSYRYWYISPPASIVKESQVDFSQGANSLVDLTSEPGAMKLRKQEGGSWSTGSISMLPDSSYGGSMVVVGDYLYVLRGLDTSTFWRYHLVNQIWEELPSTPESVYYGSSLIWDGNRYLYAFRGNSNLDFYRYDLQNATWTVMPQLPVAARPGSDMEMLKNNQIAMLFPTTTDFYIFDISSMSFVNRAPLPEIIDASHAGSGMWFDGDDTVYTYLGGYYLQHNQYRDNMAAYSISTDSWRSLARPSVNSHYMENNLASDGNGGLYVFGNDWFFGRNKHDMATRYDIATDTWSRVDGFYAAGERGTVTSDGQRYIYIIPSTTTASSRIVRYDTWNNVYSPHGYYVDSYKVLPWDQQDGNHWATGTATTAAYDGVDTLYALGANESNASRFIAHSFSKSSTEYLPPPPFIGVGGSMVYLDNSIFYLPGRSSNVFWRYDIGRKLWEPMADFPQSSVYRPGSTTLVADKDGHIYGVRGNATQFHRYTPDGGKGSWSTLASYPGGGTTYYGAATYDGDDYIYYLRSNGSSAFYRYSISGNNWQTLANLPQTTSYGESIVIRQGKIYATAGVNSNKMYIYDIAGNNWVEGTAAPFRFNWGNLMIKINDQKAIVLGSSGNADMWQFNFPDVDRGYSGLATHVSLPEEIEGLFDYATVKAEVDIPEGTSVELWTRTSADNLMWEDWKISKEVKYYDGQMSGLVTSTPQRFTQVKVILQSYDNVFTPTVESYALDYYFDIDPPTNPSVMTPYADNTKATELMNNTWYNYSRPLLDWPDVGQAGGATDGELGSNLSGYWVYFGTDETALPQTAGQFVEETEFEADLIASGTYYLRIQAQDMTGNISQEVFAPFIYKFDNTPPQNPTFITVTPSGFTARNNYTFQWPSASDAHSGIASYCYRTGATSGAFSTETCTTDLILEDVPAAYLSGTNVFYLRTLDNAGNYAASSAQVSFYYSTDPPGPVQNLRAIPPVSEQNLFAFTWELPAIFSGDPERLTYCYSINEFPSSLNTTCTTDRFISAFKAATQKGTNILYMVAKDEANNVNWNSFASANFIANTVSPGIPLNLTVTDSSDRDADRWSLTATWSKPTFEGNGIDHYIVERSTDNHTFEEIGTVSTPAFVDMMVAPETLYYYRVRAADNVDNTGGPSGVVSQQAEGRFISPPDIVSNPIPNVSFDRADIRWVTSRPSTSFVYYGTQPNDLHQSKGSLDEVSDHTVTITGLSPSTVYYFKVQSFDMDRNYGLDESYSQIYTFKTTETARIFNVTATDITLSSAIIQWQTSVPTKTKVEYGTSPDYGFQEGIEDTVTRNHFLRLTGLQSGTTYHYRIAATTEYGSVVYSDDYVFNTIPLPKVSNVRFQPILDNPTIAVEVTWTTNVPTDSAISYSAMGVTNEVASTDLVTEHRMVLEDLAGSAEYIMTIRGRDRYGNLAHADEQRWTSQVDTRSPSISEISVDVASMGIWGDAKAQMIISWKTDEPASSQVEFWQANSDEVLLTEVDPEPKTNHVVVISNLELSNIYRIKPISRDISGNEALGSEVTAVTPDRQSSLLDIIVRTLQSILGQ